MSIMEEINLLVKEAHQFSPEEQAIVDRYTRLFGPAGRLKARRVIDLKRKAAALKSSGPGVTTRNPDGSTTTRWSGYLQGGVTRQQAERDPEAAKKWNMAQQARDMMNASFAGRRGLNTMPKTQMPKMQTMPNMQKSPLKSETWVAPGAEEFLNTMPKMQTMPKNTVIAPEPAASPSLGMPSKGRANKSSRQAPVVKVNNTIF